MIETWTLVFWLVSARGVVSIHAIEAFPTEGACRAVTLALPALPLDGKPERAECYRIRPGGHILGRPIR